MKDREAWRVAVYGSQSGMTEQLNNTVGVKKFSSTPLEFSWLA